MCVTISRFLPWMMEPPDSYSLPAIVMVATRPPTVPISKRVRSRSSPKSDLSWNAVDVPPTPPPMMAAFHKSKRHWYLIKL